MDNPHTYTEYKFGSENEKAHSGKYERIFSFAAVPNLSTGDEIISFQCDQIGRFLKVLGNEFTYKSSPKRLLTFVPF